MTHIKHLFLSVLVALIGCVTMSAHSFEAVNNDGDTIYYIITSKKDLTCAVSYRGNRFDSYSNEYSGDVVIPDSVTYDGKTYSVTSIGYCAFYGCGKLTSVVIPNSVTSIGSYAFWCCSKLTSIEIPNSITSIEKSAFESCGFTSVVIPNSVTSIGHSAFHSCKKLTSVVIPNTVNSISSHAFVGCSSLTSVEIPNSVTSIGEWAFNACSSLTSVLIPNSVTSIGVNAFYLCYSLTSVEIPNSVKTIGTDAFRGCEKIKQVKCFAKNPPLINSSFNSISPDAVLYVPIQSIDKYEKSDWKNFFVTIIPIEEGYSITVNLMTDGQNGKYKNCVFELTDKSSEQLYRCTVSDKDAYTFHGLESPSYSLTMKNQWGDVLGVIDPIEIADEDVEVTFDSLRQPKTVSMTVVLPDGKDVTGDVAVSWLAADGGLMKQGTNIAGVLEGSEIACQVALSDAMLAEYAAPARVAHTVAAEGNELRIELEPLGKVMFAGNVTDANGRALPYAVLTISQLVNGKYGNSVTASTDAAGHYELELPNLPAKVTVACNGYVSQTMELENLAQGLGAVALDRISGLSVNISTDYADNANVAYRAMDASGKELDGCLYQGATIVLPSTVGIGDEIKVTAYSKNGKFKDVSKSVVLDGKNNYVQMEIVEYGTISAKCEGDGYGKVALLYNNVGELAAKASFSEGEARFDCVADGNYSLVAMTKSSTFNSILNLSALGGAGLSEGADYLLASAVAESGEVKEVAFGAIPELDETRLFLATGDGTYFMPNKSELTVGGYLTLKGKIELKDEYAGKAKNAVLIVDIPSACEFVDGSVMAGRKVTGCTKDGNRIMIPMENIYDLVRFCIIPWEAGEIRPSAFAKMEIDGNEVLLPIGSAYFEAKNFDLACVEQTGKTTIALRGAAIKDSEVLIYDNETLVGKTTALGNGQWTANITFAKPYSHSMHEIYGEVLTSDGRRLLTETKLVEYDKNFAEVEKVTMLYSNGWDHQVYEVVFDPSNGKTSRGFYNFYPGSTDFTFTADFSNTDPSSISNLTFKVLASDGTTRTLEGKYNETTSQWVASAKYADTHKLPVNVKVEYDLLNKSSYYDQERAFENKKSIYQYYGSLFNNLQNLPAEIVEQTDSCIFAEYISSETGRKIGVAFMDIDYSDYVRPDDSICEVFSQNDTTLVYYYIFDGDFVGLIVANETEKNISAVIFEELDYNIIQTKSSMKKAKIFPKWKDLSNAIKTWISDPKNYREELVTSGVSTSLDLLTGGLNDLAGLNGSYNALKEYMQWSKIMDQSSKQNFNLIKKTLNMINEKCSNGDYRIPEYARDLLRTDCEYLAFLNSHISDQFFQKLTNWNNNIKKGAIANFVVNSAQGILLGMFKPIERFKTWWGNAIATGARDYVVGQVVPSAADIISNHLTQSESKKISDWYEEEEREFLQGVDDLQQKIRNRGFCPKDEESDNSDNYNEDSNDKDKFSTPPAAPSIDPSGYVYEAVPSNRLQGVTATVYFLQQTENMYGEVTGEPVVWDAAEFGQKNPLVTDEQGMYAWDVPQGMWQVKFEKEGYETTYSDWLPVPPPQLDVNIAMVQAKQPEVVNVHAYTDGITIEFDKFMLPSTLTTQNIKVSQGGSDIGGKVTFINPEADSQGKTYCSKVEFVPERELAAGEATVFVGRKSQSYAGVMMNEDCEVAVRVEARVRDISMGDSVAVYSGSTVKVEGSVMPMAAAAGKHVVLQSMNPYIASVDDAGVAIGDDGTISFGVKGLIPGNAVVRIAFEGYDFHKDLTVSVMEVGKVARPSASPAPGEAVGSGTEVYLSCATEGAAIYYTTDGTCPCDPATAKLYDGTPIVLKKSVTIKAMAAMQDMYDSDVAEFTYTFESEYDKPMAMTRDIVKGWNWVSSFITEPQAVGGLFANGVNRVLSQTQEAVDDPVYGVVGNVTSIEPGAGYKVSSAKDFALTWSGLLVDTDERPIVLRKGWNWIGYPYYESRAIETAVVNAEEGDFVVAQGGFTEFADGAWGGSIERFDAGQGYLYKSVSDKTLQFGFAEQAARVKAATDDGSESNVHGSETLADGSAYSVHGSLFKTKNTGLDIHKYPNTMNVTARLWREGAEVTDGRYVVKAFSDSELRGEGVCVNGTHYVTVYGDKAVEIAFVVEDTETGEQFAVAETLAFTSDVVGSRKSPLALTMGAATGIAGAKTDKGAADIYTVSGVKVQRASRPGVYVVNGRKVVVR